MPRDPAARDDPSTGSYRVEVWEADGSTSQKVFDSLDDARSYADDAASEESGLIAKVFDASGKETYRGQHYATSEHARKRVRQQAGMAGVLVLRAADHGWEFRIRKGSPKVLGRQADIVDICLPDPTVARRHARIFEHGGAWHIEDLGSPCGIFINQAAIHAARAIRSRDVIRIGGVVLTAEVRDETSPLSE